MLRLLRRLAFVVVSRILRLWYTLRSDRTPNWAKGVVWTLLAYIIWPLDFSPDVVPLAGWVDDLLAVVAAGLTLQWYSRGEIKQRARDRARDLLGLTTSPEPHTDA